MTERTAKVLLVDDHEHNLTVLEAILKSDGHQLLTARSGREALEILLMHEVALALIDVQMPEMDGFELAQLMRGAEKTRHIPIVFITASSHSPQRVFNGYSVGAVDFIFKPVEPHILKSKVDVFVQLHEQKQQIAEQLRQQQEMFRLNELLSAAIAHDLRNPMQTIAAGSALILQKSNNEQVVRSTAERIHASCIRITKLIGDLLDFSTARLTGTLPANPAETNILEITKRVLLEIQLADEGARIELSVVGKMHGVWDELRMCQAISNLITNAVDHGDSTQLISIQLDGSHPDEVVWSIHNKGHIPDAILPHVFDPFRSSGTKNSASRGLGLGLYIVAQIIKTHGGSISLDSRPEAGTLFTIKLPRQAPAARQMQQSLNARALG
jgi:two-component system sensor histidine kinase/response regulator